MYKKDKDGEEEETKRRRWMRENMYVQSEGNKK